MHEKFLAESQQLIKLFQRELQLTSQHNLIQGNLAKSNLQKLFSLIITYAKELNASDIHLEPLATESRIRLRIDGELYPLLTLPLDIHPYIISYLKIQGNLDISEKRLPQDGAIVLTKEELDLRLSIIPVVYGEKAVLRLLAKGNRFFTLKEVGFSSFHHQQYLDLLHRNSGLILITGPVNSGKSTLLYATLDQLNEEQKNIITIEDPVEIKLSGIAQMQINPKAGLTYALGLKAILRQDPNIIMLGEIRDEEVAKEALRAALTGHLVLTTLHTKSALGVIPRLLNMGVDPGLLALALQGATAQRLVRKLCPHCKKMLEKNNYPFPIEDIFPAYEGPLYQATGCNHCNHTGYKGRIPLYEILKMNVDLEQAILHHPHQLPIPHDFYSLKEDGLQKIASGLTTPEEVWRAINGITFS